VAASDKPAISPDHVSELTLQRVSVYLRRLDTLAAEGSEWVSSKDLAESCRLNPAQIRRDLASFGAFGVRGVGYAVEDLRARLRRIMGLHRRHRVAIVGVGNLGRALADFGGFQGEPFQIAALFDADPVKIGTRSRSGLEVRDVRELPESARRDGIDIAIVAVPADAAGTVARGLARSGIRAVLNFTPARLELPEGLKVTNVDLSVLLETLAYFLASDARG
jgi:redox-sensing transcriptional repressor